MLDVPGLPCVVDAPGDPRVFDAWGWCSSDVLEWRRPTAETGAPLPVGRPIGGDNPPGLVFVMRAECPFLPRELARLHAFGYGLREEMALAPWAIDDATDQLFEHRVRPRDVFWLAASTLEALVWGLHDWAHFHNHGPFTEPAMTELQCDLLALAWLRGNAAAIGLGDDALRTVARQLADLSARRFEDEDVTPPATDLAALFLGPYPERPLR